MSLHPLFGASGIQREMEGLSRSAVANVTNAAWAWGLRKQILFTNRIQALGFPRDIMTFVKDDATGVFIYGLSGTDFQYAEA